MTEHQALDPLVLGRRLRHYRKKAGLTLDQVGMEVGKPAPYLSLLENGKKEPRITLVMDLAAALDVGVGELLDPSPPSKRDALEISLIQSQQTSLFESLGLPAVKPNARMDNETLAHIVGLHEALRQKSSLESAGSEEVRRANGAVARHLSESDGYLEELEWAAQDALKASGYTGEGPFSSRNLIDLSSHAGFDLRPIDDMPFFARSIVDMANRRIYIAQRNELRTRQARKAILQTLAGFLLDHEAEPPLETFLRQRVETAYFAAAVLAPESAVVNRLAAAKEQHDIDVEDVKELFYVSYEMAAWRTANLLTRHLDMRSHLLVSDEMGTIVKGYANDGVPVARDAHGGMETQRLCTKWGAVATLHSQERFGSRHQYTDTPAGTYFCTTHVEAGRDPTNAITFGVQFSDARWFRGRDTDNRLTSTCPDPACCQTAPSDLASRWEDKVVVSARSQARILGLLAADPYPKLDIPEVLTVVEAHSDAK
ncbi:MAG: helix-turn-helix domain-containing protein [Actinomycetota bacterium]|nr:helix-turn-helix domain-containing protein [Actinomycetota bacterium]